ncbi:MAG TPA: menaquinone-dependent protoporphyrinogen IX dehydrogenase [Ktedonobacteraceae bacterium]|nr:menaquinone-dependent protoporphyrinogen IX dehydrogenase [Ktedonobacteraceae bacterium]
MNKIMILYGSSEGQTAKIANHIARVIRDKGYSVDAIDGISLPAHFSLEPYTAAIIGASMHAGGYQKYIQKFVMCHHEALERIPTAFFSVSLTEAYPNSEEKVQLDDLIAAFQQETGWHPRNVASFAGALAYSKYGFLKRLLMKRIAQQAGGETDTSHDYEYTDWAAVTRFAENFVAMLRPAPKLSVVGS